MEYSQGQYRSAGKLDSMGGLDGQAAMNENKSPQRRKTFGDVDDHRERRARVFIVALAILLLITMGFSVVIGSVPVSLDNLTDLIRIRLGGDVADADQQRQIWMVIEVIRLPRTVLGVMVGSTLAICGGAMQGLFRNPLADPSIIGVSSGAALGAGVGIVLTGMLPVVLVAALQIYTVPLLAFIGGFATTIAVYKIGTTPHSGTSVATMLLAGIAIGALSGAGIGILNYMADDTTLRNLTFWMMGSLGGASWPSLLVMGPVMLVVQVVLIVHAQGLNALLLGESEARHLGIDVQTLKLRLIAMTALGVGVAVSISGMIGFVGLVVPHLVRISIGPDHRYLLPAAALLGGVLLLIADVIARVLVSPAELPIGPGDCSSGCAIFYVAVVEAEGADWIINDCHHVQPMIVVEQECKYAIVDSIGGHKSGGDAQQPIRFCGCRCTAGYGDSWWPQTS